MPTVLLLLIAALALALSLLPTIIGFVKRGKAQQASSQAKTPSRSLFSLDRIAADSCDFKKCSFCNRIILKEAIGCKHCGHDLPPEPLDRALADVNEAIGLRPTNVGAYSRRGALYSRMGKQDLAIADCNEALRLDSKEWDALSSILLGNRGFVYNNMGNYDVAIRDLDQAIHLNPMNAFAQKNRAVSYERKGELQKALDGYNLAVEIDSRMKDAVEGMKRVRHALAVNGGTVSDAESLKKCRFCAELVRADAKDCRRCG